MTDDEKRSKKLPKLDYIFQKKYNESDPQERITFTLDDIKDAYKSLGEDRPSSISNTVLDLTRKNRPIENRLPYSIHSLGYDIAKRTGVEVPDVSDKDASNSKRKKVNYAGEFIFVGVGKTLEQWLIWPEETEHSIKISSSSIPESVLSLIRNDEGGLLSIVDYTDALSIALNGNGNSVARVQNPMKWQPNEIDGFYTLTETDSRMVFPIEVKAISTQDDVNLIQMRGGVKTLCLQLEREFPGVYTVTPLAIQGISNGFKLAVFESTKTDINSSNQYKLELKNVIYVTFNPRISNLAPSKKQKA